MLVDTRICGIPCTVRVLSAEYTKPDSNCWSSDWDYYGGWELDWEVCDRRGRPAPWLARKMTDADTGRLEKELVAYIQNLEE